MWVQKVIRLQQRSRGFHLITEEIEQALQDLGSVETGLLHVFIQHTSASLTINEDIDPAVRADFASFFDRLVPENEPYYEHTLEGSDDLPAHLKSSLLSTSVQVPVTHGSLNLGRYQGVYLCEHRNDGGRRSLVVTLHGE